MTEAVIIAAERTSALLQRGQPVGTDILAVLVEARGDNPTALRRRGRSAYVCLTAGRRRLAIRRLRRLIRYSEWPEA